MTEVELKAILDQTGLPVAHVRFKTKTKPPFIIFFSPGTDSLVADDEVYIQINKFRVELYGAERTHELEKTLENIFKAQGIVWEEKTMLYIDSEDLFMVIYEFEED